MYEKLLEDSGLTKNESIVYITLLKIGKSKAGEIIRESKISSGKIYETLDKLSSKGLVKSISENGVKHFIASDPQAILSYMKDKQQSIKDKEEEFKKHIPEFEKLRKLENKEEIVSMIKGFREPPIVYDALENGKSIKIMGVRSSKDVKFNNFWKNWHRRRLELKKKALMLFSDKNTDYWRFFKNLKYTEVRETLHFSPSAILIIDNNSFIFSYDEELVCIHIISESVAKSFSGFFDGLWEFSRK